MRVAWCALFAMLLASVAHASNYVVDGAGGGNFTLIQSAVYAQAVSPRDTVFVRSGSYPEVVTFTNDVPMMWLVGVAGASATTLLSITVSSDVFDRRWYFDGLKFDGAMDLGRKGYVAEFKRCVFAQGLSEELDCWPGNLTDCAFHGRTFVTGGASGGIGPEFTRLHFIGAPLHIESSGCGDLTYADCTFEGPADTLVIGKAGRADNAIRIVRSNFANADFGLVFPEQGYFDQDDVVDSCSFSDLAIAGVWHDEPPNTTSSGGRSTRVMTCAVKHSRFDRCGTAVHWLTGFAGAQTMLADTIRDCTGDGVVATLGTMTDVIISRSGGHGLVLERRGIRPSPRALGSVTISSCRFVDNAGDGLRVEDATAATARFDCVLENSVAERNTGAGFRVVGANWALRDNVARANAGGGILLTTLQSGWTDTVESNSLVSNGGDGLRLERSTTAGGATQFATHNLSALNHGVGIRTVSSQDGSVAFNDSWSNAGGDFVNVPFALDSNLSVDPKFCDDVAGDLTLAIGSPAGAGGIYGLLGALPEVCKAPVPRPLAFKAHPNPARGAVEFVLPRGGADGRIEVLDLNGRRRWEQIVHADGSTVRWSGQTDHGVLPPGLYWARFTRTGETRLVPLVWLR